MSRSGSDRRRRPLVLAIAICVVIGLLALGTSAGAAPAKPRDTVTIRMLMTVNSMPGWDLVIPNFKRAYPNVRVDVSYAPNNPSLFQLETTQLAAGNAPELLATNPGCGTPIAICVLAKAGSLSPMVKRPWATKTRSLPLLTSKAKFGPVLYGFVPQVAPFGVFTNDTLFKQFGLNIPQTYAQLLDVCRKAKAAGTVAIILAGGGTSQTLNLIEALVLPFVYAKDKQWTRKLKAGKVTFSGSSGWRRGLQRFADMNAAGCFQPGAAGVTSGAAQAALFTQGRGLMLPITSSSEGLVAAASPKFDYSFHRFPSGASATETTTLLNLLQSVSVNAHASARNQAAAQTFIDFLARPKQNELFTRATGGLSPNQLAKGEIPAFMLSMTTVLAERKYVINPAADWWNAGVTLALQQNEVGLITGQRSVDDILNAMDAAWKQGPS